MAIERSSHLKALEDESIHIIREVAAQAERRLSGIRSGRTVAVMLHLARKAFFPGRIPFPLLHIDTTWKFRDMISFRDEAARKSRARPAYPHQPGGLRRKVNPFDYDSGTAPR